MTRLKRRASQELLPTRGPKLIRRDPSVFALVSGKVSSAARFVSANAAAFCEGIHLVRLFVTCVIRFSRSCFRGRDAQTVSPSKTIPPTVAYTSQTDASTYSKRIQGRTTTFYCNIASAFLHTFTYSQARNHSIITSPSPRTSPSTRSCRYITPDPPNKLGLIRITLVLPSTIAQQGSQESVTSVESLLLSAQRRRRNGLKDHSINGLPSYYESRDHIHVKRVCAFWISIFCTRLRN